MITQEMFNDIKLALFAAMAPEPDEDTYKTEHEHDRIRNPHNDSYKPPIRGRGEIRAQHKFKLARAMMKEMDAIHAESEKNRYIGHTWNQS